MDNQQRQQMETINHNTFLSSQSQMNPVYSKQKQALNEFTSLIALLYINYAVDGLLKLNAAQKISTIRQIENKLKSMYKELGNYEESKLTDLLKETYKEVYNDLYVILADDKAKKQKLTDEEIMLAVNMPIAGEIYTERIWKNKDKTVNLLRKASNNILKGDMTIDEATEQIQNVFNVGAYDSKRLADTEDTRVQAQASIDTGNNLGIKQHMWSATFENSCKECMDLDGKIFGMDDSTAPTIPLHSNCQCLWINVPNEDTNGGNSDIINNNYDDYKKQLVGMDTSDGITISDLSSHGYDRIIGDDNRKGVGIDSVKDAITNPLDIKPVKVDSLGRKSKRYIGEKAEIVINPDKGNIVSVNPTSTKKAEKLLKKGNENNGN